MFLIYKKSMMSINFSVHPPDVSPIISFCFSYLKYREHERRKPLSSFCNWSALIASLVYFNLLFQFYTIWTELCMPNAVAAYQLSRLSCSVYRWQILSILLRDS